MLHMAKTSLHLKATDFLNKEKSSTTTPESEQQHEYTSASIESYLNAPSSPLTLVPWDTASPPPFNLKTTLKMTVAIKKTMIGYYSLISNADVVVGGNRYVGVGVEMMGYFDPVLGNVLKGWGD